MQLHGMRHISSSSSVVVEESRPIACFRHLLTPAGRHCSADITRGVRASAANWVAAEGALKQGAAAARGVLSSHVLPAARRGAPALRGGSNQPSEALTVGRSLARPVVIVMWHAFMYLLSLPSTGVEQRASASSAACYSCSRWSCTDSLACASCPAAVPMLWMFWFETVKSSDVMTCRCVGGHTQAPGTDASAQRPRRLRRCVRRQDRSPAGAQFAS